LARHRQIKRHERAPICRPISKTGQTGTIPEAQLGRFLPGARPKIQANAPNVLIFSPHPDDECITGGLALRLLREAKWNVVNVAVTLGSNRARQAARRRELQNACAALGFKLIVPGARIGATSIRIARRKIRALAGGGENNCRHSRGAKAARDFSAARKRCSSRRTSACIGWFWTR
jgi:hypothetical protein